MKFFIFLAFLACVRADCNGISPELCSQFQRASKSIGEAIEASNDALATAMTEAATRTAAVYQASFNILRTAIPQSNVKSVEDVLALQARMEAALTEAKATQADVLDEAVEAFEDANNEVTQVLGEAILSARDHDSEAAEAVAFAVSGSKIQAVKQKLKDALAKAHGKVKEIIKKAIEKINSGMAKLEGFLSRILGEAGIKKVQELLAQQVERLIKILTDALVKKIEGKTQSSFNLAVVDTEAFIDDLEADSRIAKRSAFWDRVKAAVKKLGANIRESAMKAINKHKPIIMQKLKELGKAVIAAGKDIIIEIVNGAIKAIVQ